MLHLSCVHASRIGLSGTCISELENKEYGTRAVTPRDILIVGTNQDWVWDWSREGISLFL